MVCTSLGSLLRPLFYFLGPVVKKVPFRNGSQNSLFRWELSVSCNAKRIILQNGPAIETELFLQQAPGRRFISPVCTLYPVVST